MYLFEIGIYFHMLYKGMSKHIWIENSPYYLGLSRASHMLYKALEYVQEFWGVFFEDEVAFKRICGLSVIIPKRQYKLHK